MKKITLLTLICFTVFSTFSQNSPASKKAQGDTLKTLSQTASETMFELGVENVVILGRGDTLNLDAPVVLSNGQPLGANPIVNTSIYNVLRSYDADQREADGNDDYMFIDAFSKADVIWIPKQVPWDVNPGEPQYLIEGDVEIPWIKKLIFEVEATIDVQGSLKGNYTLIDAGVQQIFTVTSNLSTEDYDWASSNVARPEWFGGVPFGQPFNARDALQKCIDVFKRNILLDGAIYYIEGTINMNSINTLKISPLTIIEVSAATPDDPLFKITKEPFMIDGGLISVPQGYHSWIFDVAID
jgi:hypothetical protein